jgi:predicted AAA+ superfamily ATPase
MEYLGYFSDAYLFFYVPRFSYSQKVQLVNPKKVFTNDNGLVEVNSLSFGDDNGRMLENMVFMHLRRRTKRIYYFAEKKECDLVVFERGKVPVLYQVCWQLDSTNLDRELAGLSDAMDFFNVKEGMVVTFDQSDSFTIGNKIITALPFHQWAVSGGA